MTLEQMLIVSLLIVLAVCGLYMLIEWVDRTRPKYPEYVQRDYVADRKRRIERNGFKSRMGMASYNRSWK